MTKEINQCLDIIIQHSKDPVYDNVIFYGKSKNLILLAKRIFKSLIVQAGIESQIKQESTHGIGFDNGMKVLFREYDPEMHQEYRAEKIDNSLIIESI